MAIVDRARNSSTDPSFGWAMEWKKAQAKRNPVIPAPTRLASERSCDAASLHPWTPSMTRVSDSVDSNLADQQRMDHRSFHCRCRRLGYMVRKWNRQAAEKRFLFFPQFEPSLMNPMSSKKTNSRRKYHTESTIRLDLTNALEDYNLCERYVIHTRESKSH